LFLFEYNALDKKVSFKVGSLIWHRF